MTSSLTLKVLAASAVVFIAGCGSDEPTGPAPDFPAGTYRLVSVTGNFQISGQPVSAVDGELILTADSFFLTARRKTAVAGEHTYKDRGPYVFNDRTDPASLLFHSSLGDQNTGTVERNGALTMHIQTLVHVWQRK